MQLQHDRIVAAGLLALVVVAVLAAANYGGDKVADYRCAHHLPGQCATAVRR